jgi:hypothetical protein
MLKTDINSRNNCNTKSSKECEGEENVTGLKIQNHQAQPSPFPNKTQNRTASPLSHRISQSGLAPAVFPHSSTSIHTLSANNT